MTKLKQLQAQIERLRKEAEALKAQEVRDVIARIKQAIEEYDLTVTDLFGPGALRGRRRSTGAKGTRRAKGVVPIKYRDSEGNTWTGRGLKPRWLTAALAQGKSLDDFAV